MVNSVARLVNPHSQGEHLIVSFQEFLFTFEIPRFSCWRGWRICNPTCYCIFLEIFVYFLKFHNISAPARVAKSCVLILKQEETQCYILIHNMYTFYLCLCQSENKGPKKFRLILVFHKVLFISELGNIEVQEGGKTKKLHLINKEQSTVLFEGSGLLVIQK